MEPSAKSFAELLGERSSYQVSDIGDRLERITEAIDELRALELSPGWKRVLEAMEREVGRCEEILRSETEVPNIYRMQAAIKNMRWLRSLPTQLTNRLVEQRTAEAEHGGDARRDAGRPYPEL